MKQAQRPKDQRVLSQGISAKSVCRASYNNCAH
jgi:hypothetical protein